MKPNWKALFLEARKLIQDDTDRHHNACGCQDEFDRIENGGVVEGMCPGLKAMQDFLKKTQHLVGSNAQKAD